jgi:hypothetical protein
MAGWEFSKLIDGYTRFSKVSGVHALTESPSQNLARSEHFRKGVLPNDRREAAKTFVPTRKLCE